MTFNDLIQQGDQILAADNATPEESRHKLTPYLRRELEQALQGARVASNLQGLEEGRRREASDEFKAAFAEGGEIIRSVNRFVNSLNDTLETPVDIAAIRQMYGLGRVLSNNFTKGFIRETLQTFKANSPVILPPEARLRPSVLARIDAVLALIAEKEVASTTSGRQNVTDQKEDFQKLLEEAVARVRYYLWAMLPQLMYDPHLHQYGFVPRQEREGTPPT